MRRPSSSGLLALLVGATAATVGAARAGAQSSSAIRRAFEPAVTPFVGVTGFGVRTTGVVDVNTAPGEFDYNNGIALGAQLDLPLTRRTGVIATLAVTPASRVNLDFGEGGLAELDRAVVAGVDVGFAGRLKPGAPLFVYAGGGGVFATKRAAGDREGSGFDPRVSGGLGLDFLRRERTGFRVAYLAHLVFPSSPDESRWVPESSTFDYTVVLGGRFTLGTNSGDRQ